MYVPEEALENVRTILLHVITVRLPNEEPLGNDTDGSTNTVGRPAPSQEDVTDGSTNTVGRPVPSQEDVTDWSTNTVGRPVPSQEDVGEHLPSCSVSSLHIDSCFPTNVTVANKVEEKEKKKEKEEEVVAVKKKKKEEEENTPVEATCELSPPAKRPRLQQSMCSQLLLPLVDSVEGEGFKETNPCGANVSEACVHKEDSGALLITVLRQCSAWVLDVDLDFFSTSNPFKSLFTEVNYYWL